MADEADLAIDNEQDDIAMAIHRVQQAAKFERGIEGECEGCGEWKSRIVRGHCARCCDEHRLP